MGLLAAVSIGIGGMVGAGIFSILGVVAAVSGTALPLGAADDLHRAQRSSGGEDGAPAVARMALLATLVAAFVIEVVYRARTGRRFQRLEDQPATPTPPTSPH